MYKISVPIMNFLATDAGCERYLEELKRLDADRVFLYEGLCDPDTPDGKQKIENLSKNCAFFKSHGLEVGSWSGAFDVEPGGPYEYVTSPDGRKSGFTACPTDKNLQNYYGRFVEALAGTGVDMIMIDDGYRFGFLDMGIGCVCKNHIKLMEEELGEKIDSSRLKEYLLSGGPNKVRSAWLHANGKSLEDFAAVLRERIDRINPSVRLGYCSCMTNWDIDGTTPDRIAKIMAGNTKPFYRLIGAAYWAPMLAWGNRISDSIELERMEKSWNEDSDIEIFSEGDVFPRPRFKCPAAYLEGFDTALRADGRLDGILKYGLDYFSNPGYETGYQLRHERHRELYRQIAKAFDGKTACGLRVYEAPAKLADMEIPKEVAGGDLVQHLFFSYAARAAVNCAIPTTYDGFGCGGIVFGANAKFIPDEALNHGLIIDAEAAKLLSERGIDVGVEAFGEKTHIANEYFMPEPNAVNLFGGADVIKIKTKPEADIESWFDSGKTLPGSFRYENKAGQKFLVLCFNGYFAAETLFRQYTRAAQFISAVEWFGTPLPATCQGQPDLYMLEKSDDKGNLAVGLWNFCVDDMPDAVVKLAKTYEHIETIECEAVLDGSEVRIKYIQPFAFAGIVLS